MEGIEEISTLADAQRARRTTVECVIIGGLGGTMPTLTRLGAALVTESDPSLPHPAFIIGLGIYFVIGAVLVYAFSEKSVKRAFLTGIAAPALIANVVAGVQEATDTRAGSVPREAVEKQQAQVGDLWFIRTVHAQTVPPTEAAMSRPQNTGSSPQAPGDKLPAREYLYRVETRTQGTGDIIIELVAHQEDGKTRTLTLGRYSVVELKTVNPLVSIEVAAPGTSRLITLTPEQKRGASVDIDAEVTTKRGLLWALGGRDAPTVEQLRIAVEPLN